MKKTYETPLTETTRCTTVATLMAGSRTEGDGHIDGAEDPEFEYGGEKDNAEGVDAHGISLHDLWDD